MPFKIFLHKNADKFLKKLDENQGASYRAFEKIKRLSKHRVRCC